MGPAVALTAFVGELGIEACATLAAVDGNIPPKGIGIGVPGVGRE